MWMKKEIEALLTSLDLKMHHVPEIFRSDTLKVYSFLTLLLKGKQNYRKQSVMIVGQGSSLPSPLLLYIVINIITIIIIINI